MQVHLGNFAEYEWTVVNTSYYYITFKGGDGRVYFGIRYSSISILDMSIIILFFRNLQVGFKADYTCGSTNSLLIEFNGEIKYVH